MRIQNILLPKIEICTKEEMFFRREKNFEREITYDCLGEKIHFLKNGKCNFNSYFNILSIEKWKKYTNIEKITLNLYLKGKFEVVLTNIEYIDDKVINKVLAVYTVNTDKKTLCTFPYKLYEYKGVLSFELRALEDNSIYYNGYYGANIDESLLCKTNIAINICTYKREAFVLRNIENLKKYILENNNNPLNEHLKVFISDNGKTLKKENISNQKIYIVSNKNVGGAGGFTRGLIEIMNDTTYEATHVLMMDDDVIIEPEALFRTYVMLCCRKKKYENMFIGGAMLRIDQPNIQIESGASWNSGNLISNKKNYDINKIKYCLLNELEEYVEFNAWWYCCMPISIIKSYNLPLPIFIRGDDVEYGLRNMKNLVLINGICVWHEAFENKYSSFLQYYITRNLLYNNAIHCKKYSVFDFLLYLYKTVARELVYYRYRNINLIFKAVNDYLKGIEFLLNEDGELLHKNIMNNGYKSLPIEELKVNFHINDYNNSKLETEGKLSKLFRFITINGYLLPVKTNANIKIVPMVQCRPINFYRQKKILNYDMISKKGFITKRKVSNLFITLIKLIKISVKLLFRFNKATKQFKENNKILITESFWKKYLDI